MMTISDQLSKEWNFVKYRFQLHFIRDEKVSLSLCFTLKINKMKIEKGESINFGIGISFDKKEINILFIKWYLTIFFKN